eukprot:119515-Amphidinium_carterae.1
MSRLVAACLCVRFVVPLRFRIRANRGSAIRILACMFLPCRLHSSCESCWLAQLVNSLTYLAGHHIVRALMVRGTLIVGERDRQNWIAA